jgi:hypothetical protein
MLYKVVVDTMAPGGLPPYLHPANHIFYVLPSLLMISTLAFANACDLVFRGTARSAQMMVIRKQLNRVERHLFPASYWTAHPLANKIIYLV